MATYSEGISGVKILVPSNWTLPMVEMGADTPAGGQYSTRPADGVFPCGFNFF
jgi:hypothetical protein